MSAARSRALVLALACASGGLGCAAPRAVAARIDAVEGLAHRGRDQGAYRCAPEELARAVAHLEFARLELDQGDLPRAREHLVLADANARAAVRLSADAGCETTRDGEPEARAPARAAPEAHHAPLTGSLSLARADARFDAPTLARADARFDAPTLARADARFDRLPTRPRSTQIYACR